MGMELNDRRIKDMLDSDISFDDFYDFLKEYDIGDWDYVNSTETIKNYVTEMMRQDVSVGHILSVIEAGSSTYGLYAIWLGNSMETPKPINSKKDLFEALGGVGPDG